MFNDINLYYEMLRKLTQSIIITDKIGRRLELKLGIERMASSVVKCGRRSKKLMFIGNGASASISSHMAIDFWKQSGIKAMAFNDASQLTCLSNDYGYEHVFAKPMEIFSDKGDILIAISSSGASSNILHAVKIAKSKGVRVITLTGFSKDNPLRKIGDMNFYVPADKYSHVEIMHHSICHYLLDIIACGKKKKT